MRPGLNEFLKVSRVLLVFFNWVVPSLSLLYWVSPSFTLFHWVLLGFHGFNCVFRSSTRFFFMLNNFLLGFHRVRIGYVELFRLEMG